MSKSTIKSLEQRVNEIVSEQNELMSNDVISEEIHNRFMDLEFELDYVCEAIDNLMDQ